MFKFSKYLVALGMISSSLALGACNGDDDDGATTQTPTTDPSTTGDGDGDGDGDGVCAPTCDEAIDCCNGVEACEDGLGEYPYNLECDRGFCTSSGCSDDEQCTFGGALPDWGCVDLGDFGICAEPCETDEDCESDFFEFTCDDNFCIPVFEDPEGCSDDEECEEGYACWG